MPATLYSQYAAIRSATERICEKLKPEDYVPQPAAWVSPPKWHLGHTTWFFETFIVKQALNGYQEFHPDYNFLFNSYYETIGQRVLRDKRGHLFRPPVQDIYAYRQHVDEAIRRLLNQGISTEMEEVIALGLQHEQQHQELLVTDTKYIFWQHPLLPAWDESVSLAHFRQTARHEWLEVKEGVYDIGHEGEGFCFDNELGKHKQYLQPFSIMDRPVTNGEYLEFIEAGGYKDFRYWLSEGWEWVRREGIQSPMYWHHMDGSWQFFHLNGLHQLDRDLPLMHISYYEADAYAHWKGLRLPTEFEWETAAKIYPTHFRNIVWEWTRSAYLPYPGFRIAEGAIGEYNGKFMVSQMVLRGGSIATPAGHTRPSYRNFFHPQMQWQFSGLRLCRD